ncbi:hypothetical protein LIPSTDRAFT_145153 [Lipomyces starkeyi NRRL Y-11557]|uniref:Uncharacterized protein n=1 Tax=Lipomyces starkeyi NRRL Y-11557 TaxID=675824 RepID=A0A1E3QGP4_LIPST|nr:hypothetical protein LIPSTDRAFT_145153 [Lipomyces starkeyi NRRL Y-11557]
MDSAKVFVDNIHTLLSAIPSHVIQHGLGQLRGLIKVYVLSKRIPSFVVENCRVNVDRYMLKVEKCAARLSPTLHFVLDGHQKVVPPCMPPGKTRWQGDKAQHTAIRPGRRIAVLAYV